MNQKTIEKKFEQIIPKLKRKYSFLRDVSIDVVAGYGTTHFNPAQNSIFVALDHVEKIWNTPRFVKRLGKIKNPVDFTFLVLLHEIAHVRQEATEPPNRLKAALLEIQPGDNISHDESWVEKEADRWAKQEFKKWKA